MGNYHEDKNKEAGRKLAQRLAGKEDAKKVGLQNGGWAGVVFVWIGLAVIAFFLFIICASVYGLWLKYFWHGFIQAASLWPAVV